MKIQRDVTPEHDSTDLPGWAAIGFLAGSASALLGGYWDDAWHTIEGRDSFFIAPHIAIYTGITLAGGSLAGWALLAARRAGARSILRNGPLLTALLAVALTLSSAPVDNAWHVAFGRDAVIWSPPHILGIVGTLGLAVAMLVALRASSAPWARYLVDPTGGLIIAAAAFVVVEYDTDVPQFSYLWYLPALSLAAGFALAVIRRLSGAQLGCARAALWHLGFIGIVSAVLLAGGYDAVRVPVLLLPAVALDISAQRRFRPLPRSALVTTALATPSLVLILTGSESTLAGSEIVLSVLLAFVAVAATTTLVLGSPAASTSVTTARAMAVVLALTVAWSGAASPSARAHDPGQGEDAGTVDLLVRADGRALTMTARRLPLAADPTQLRVVARRAGQALSAPLSRAADGSLTGTVTADSDGRWFVYLEAAGSGGRQVESWLPVDVGTGSAAVRERRRFAYTTDAYGAATLQVIAGVLLYGIVAAFIVALSMLVRRAAPKPIAARG